MKREQIRNALGRLVGTIDRTSDGRLIGRDQNGRLQGSYNPRTNQTRDSVGKLFGRSNQLIALIRKQ